jgi:hypothetical protein
MDHRIRTALAAGIVATACAFAPTARADEVRTIAPPTPEHPGRVDPMLVMTGAVLFGIPYATSVAIAATSSVPTDQWLYLPVAGPVVDLIVRNTCATEGCKGDVGSVALPLAINALAQAGGVAALVTAFTSPGKPPVSAYAGNQPPKPRVRVTPTTYAGGAGVAAVGTW